MDAVAENLYIGEYSVLNEPELLTISGISHVLSLVSARDTVVLPTAVSLEHMAISVNDVEDEDLLQHFERSNEFIARGAQTGGVLVHCVSGVSRSSAFVCAYLMATRKWTPEQALAHVQTSRSLAQPNPGFLVQLDIFYKHGYCINSESKLYREWKLGHQSAAGPQVIYTRAEMAPFRLSWRNIVPLLAPPGTSVTRVVANGKMYSVTEFVDSPNYAHVELEKSDGALITVDPLELRKVLEKAVQRTYIYRCKFCSTTLASSSSIVRHERGQGMCQHFFIEPIEWMRPELEKGALEGRLSCHHCAKKVGSYFWQGSRCSCSAWVTPSFKLSKDKVDEMLKR